MHFSINLLNGARSEMERKLEGDSGSPASLEITKISQKKVTQMFKKKIGITEWLVHIRRERFY